MPETPSTSCRQESLKLICRYPRLFLKVTGQTFLMAVKLHLQPLKNICENCAKRPARIEGNSFESDLVYRFSSIVERHVLRSPSCLRSSLVLFAMLPSPARLTIGVTKQSNTIDAHAWITFYEKIYSGTIDFKKFEPILETVK